MPICELPTNGTATAPPLRWHVPYRAALFETDRDELPRRIADAKRAIIARAQELFASSADNIEEDQLLEDALYALSALQNCPVV